MPWYLILGFGLILGALADRALIVLGDYLTARPVAPEIAAQFRPAEDPEPNGTPEAVKPTPRPAHQILVEDCPEWWTAKQILGYCTIGRPATPPQYPGGLEAWDRRNRREVA